MCNQKFKYIKGALVIAETKCEGREKEIIKSAAQMIDKIAGEIENSEKQIIALKLKAAGFVNEYVLLEQKLADMIKQINAYKTEIENKQYTITCASEENQQLKESLADARAEIESLTRSLTIVANWKNVKRTYTADEVKEFARGILDVAALEAAKRGE